MNTIFNACDKPESPARRRVLALSAGLLAGAAGPVLAQPQNADLSAVQLRISVYKGHITSFFEAAGVADFPYKVSYHEFPTASNLLVEAVSNGVIDLAGSSNVSTIFVPPERARFRQISSLHSDANSYLIVVPKDSPITSVGQLRGKNVAFLRSTTPHYFMLKTLAAHGLTHRDIRAVPMMQQDGYAAFRGGRLDAWVVGGLYSALAVKDGARVIARGGDYFHARGTTVAGLDILSTAPGRAAVEDYLRREKHTHAWVESHPEQWAAQMESISKVPRALWLAQFKRRSNPSDQLPVDAVAIRDQQDVVASFVAGGLLQKAIDVTPLWDARFNAALKA